MPIHAFVDESRRGSLYCVAAAIATPVRLRQLRRELRGPARAGDEPARQACIERLTRNLLDRGAHRLVLDSRSNRDVKDEVTIRRVIGRHTHSTQLVYEHVSSTSEPLLWVADSVAWCFSAGGTWRRRVEPVIAGVIDVGWPQ